MVRRKMYPGPLYCVHRSAAARWYSTDRGCAQACLPERPG